VEGLHTRIEYAQCMGANFLRVLLMQREQKDACELERNDAKSLALLYSIVPHETCSLFEEG
jgi:hypothetical protein